jgi:tRNA threonylcarbamoyladenosine biosynthesis protein TsaB
MGLGCLWFRYKVTVGLGLIKLGKVNLAMRKMASPPEVSENPYILAIETATQASSVALFRGEELLGSIEYHEGRSHARLLTLMVARLLEDLEVDRKQLAAVSVAKGPGSYTGLRVGVSTAKGLCMALDIPLLAVGSLEALAWQVAHLARQTDSLICPVIDARRMEVYAQVWGADLMPQSEPYAWVVEGPLPDWMDGRKVIFVGDGAAKCTEYFTQNPHAIVLPDIISSARGMGIPSFRKFSQNTVEDLVTFEPFYLKDFVATPSKKQML